MRKGELFGLRRSDVDLAGDVITVARPCERETTKGGARRRHSHRDPEPGATGRRRA
jgi:hypothetical protein